MKFIHAADLHLRNATWSKRDVRGDSIRALVQIIQLASEHTADAIVLAGDLFDSDKPESDVVRAFFGAIVDAPCPVLYVNGNHDPSNWPGVLPIPLAAASKLVWLHERTFEVGGYRFYGIDSDAGESLIARLNAVPADTDVLVLHQLIQESVGELLQGQCGVDAVPQPADPQRHRYVALGDLHKPWTSQRGNNLFAYPGSTYMCSFNDPPTHQVLLVELQSHTRPATITGLPLKSRPVWRRRLVDVEQLNQTLAEADTLRIEFEKRVADNALHAEADRPIVEIRYDAGLRQAGPALQDAFSWAHLFISAENYLGDDSPNLEAAQAELSLAEAVRASMGDRYDEQTAQLVQQLLSDAPVDATLETWAASFGFSDAK